MERLLAPSVPVPNQLEHLAVAAVPLRSSPSPVVPYRFPAGSKTMLPLAWIIHPVSSQKRKDALKGMMNTGFADPAFPFGASIA